MKTTLSIVALLALFEMPLLAQSNVEHIAAAEAALRSGEYDKARTLFKRVLDRDVARGVKYFDTYLAKGEYEKGVAEVDRYLEKAPRDPFLLNAKGRLLMCVGDYAAAESAFRISAALQPDLRRNSADLAELLRKTGRKSEAGELNRALYRDYLRHDNPSPDFSVLAAIAASRLGQFHAANDILNNAYREDPTNIQLLLTWANLFRAKYNDADAQRTFEEALELNPHDADLLAGYARAGHSFLGMEQLAERALRENPNHVPSMNILAELHILDSRYDEAETMLQRAREINPSSLTSLANLASVFHFRHDVAAYAAIERKVLNGNPGCGDFYNILANNCDLRFRYKDAVSFGEKAVAVEPDNWNAQARLGNNLLRIGRAREAYQHLTRAYENDNFNLFALNSLNLIEGYEHFETMESEHFSLKIHESEKSVLGTAILQLAEEAYDSLRSRYPYQPENKILLEAYNEHSDFAVRISGLPNLDLVGVCFGDIVAFDTPRAYIEDEYNWARTLWHELAHVMTMGLSDHRIPRWLTEGLSVYEEKKSRPEWGREMELEFFAALDRDKLLPLERINSGFTRPEFPLQVLLSYYQSMKVVEFLEQNYGFGLILDLIDGFKSRRDLETLLPELLDKTVEEVNAEFFAQLEKERDAVGDVVAMAEAVFEEEKRKPSALEKIFKKENNPFFENCIAGITLLREGKYAESEARLLEAINIYPSFIGAGNPYHTLAALYRQQGDTLKLTAILEQFLAISEFGAEESRELADYYTSKREFERAEHYYRRSFHIAPYEITARMNLADIYAQQRKHDREAEQRRAILALDPVDKAEASYKLALSLYHNQQLSEARRQVLETLELAPGYRDAQKLLLLCAQK